MGKAFYGAGVQDILPWVDRNKEYHYVTPPGTVVSHGTCLKCGAKNEDLGDSLCLKCYDQASKRMVLYYRHKAQGLCVDCTKTALHPYIRCPGCHERHRSYYNTKKTKRYSDTVEGRSHEPEIRTLPGTEL